MGQQEETVETAYLGEEEVQEPEVNEQGQTLLDYLCTNPVEGESGEVQLQGRLQNFTFKIGSMTKQEHEKYLKQSVVRNGTKVIDQKLKMFNELVVINHCLYPKFKDEETLKRMGEISPTKALYKVLKVGEVEQLARAILEFNGFAAEPAEIRAKAKN